MRPALNFLSRRLFLSGIAAAGTISGPGLRGAEVETSPRRAKEAYRIRVEAARFDRDTPVEAQRSNGDEELLSSKAGNYSKGLPHDDAGEVDPNAYATFA